jgi:1-pyrroline-5-carboxylate dehydrogenase
MSLHQDYRNEPIYDYTTNEQIHAQKAALEAVRSRFGQEYPCFINGEKISVGTEKIVSHNPSNVDEVIGIFPSLTQQDIEYAMESAYTAYSDWSRVPAEERASYLFKAAQVIRERRHEINAWMISEVGKNYMEADADTAEAIDFLEFYGREAIRYSKPQPVHQGVGETNEYFYVPLGVGIVISPWNFPFAIHAGMCSAAIAAGNCVIAKPASESPMMGWLFADIMHSVGLPKGVLNFVVGNPKEIGDYMIDHPKTRFISFTGSMEIGLRVNERAAKAQPGQKWIKRVVAEMGGKDGILVDASADIDAAVKGVVSAAFGFQGQKCSACSRAIVHQDIYDEFVEKLVAETANIQIGDAKDNYRMGPVSSAKAEAKILEYIAIGAEEGRIVHGGKKAEGNGYYIEPTIIADVAPTARLAQEEIFGPVLAVIKANDFDHGLEIANNTLFGLTGSVYTADTEKLERARHEFHVGNLYLNRKCTGALVGVHPFGGFNMSGTDSKAGSYDYLMLFMQGKSVAKKK